MWMYSRVVVPGSQLVDEGCQVTQETQVVERQAAVQEATKAGHHSHTQPWCTSPHATHAHAHAHAPATLPAVLTNPRVCGRAEYWALN